MTTDAPGDPEAIHEAPEADSADGRDDGAPDAAADGDEAPAPVTKARDDAKERKHLPVWQESVLLLGIALVLAVVIKTFFVQAFYIPSESMEPGLIRNDRILVQKVSYWFGGDPARGDVVVFEDPGGWLTGEEPAPTGLANVLSKIGLYPTGGHLVKRVIGTEGDVIECCDDEGRILVNGEPVDESIYIAKRRQCAGQGTGFGCEWKTEPVPEGKLFVLGDNRGSSSDSRAHMCQEGVENCTKSPWVDTDLVVGKVFALVWPQDRWDWISNPGVFDDVPDDPPAQD
ncbi:signal peptidase I [Nocardioides sp. HM23]|uniref:signal peptidase I n=1 Tax=Nocardioides bizhenqiangii TaxID=3095076 RepID=UPI002ACAD296|nr:signal peptidase I [Nocardioides sp. HM23]MDZ5623140.1 signal peptidase I [Nocardioides sp. HM23]